MANKVMTINRSPSNRQFSFSKDDRFKGIRLANEKVAYDMDKYSSFR